MERYVLFSFSTYDGIDSILIIIKESFPSQSWIKQQIREGSKLNYTKDDIIIIGWCEFKDYGDYACFADI